MSVHTDPRIGTELAGYRIERLLGRGGMGVVYLAHDLQLDRPVALKLLAPALAEDSEFRARFLRESRLAASIDHPNVIPIYEAGETDGTLFIAMRYVEGTDLRELLYEQGPLEPERAILLLGQVASALDAAHVRGLVHRDVKPGNILLDAGEHVYLGDFGLTRRAEDPDAGPAAGNSLGTVDYVAPEQIDAGPIDGRADVYSLGCVLYQCLTGHPPFQSSSPMGVLWDHLQTQPPSASTETGLPDAIDPVLARAIAKDPDERQPTCQEVIDQARSGLGLTRPPRRRLILALAALAAAAVAAAIAIPLTLNQTDTTPTAKPTDTTPTLTITRDSVQHIDPATNTLAGTTRLGGHITQIAIGEGGVWVADPIPGPGGPRSATVFRLAPRTGEITGRVRGGAATNLAVGLGSVWVVDNGFYVGTMRAIDPRNLEARGVPLDLKYQSSSGGGPMAVGESVWVVATTSLQGTGLRISDTSVWAIGGSCDAGPCFVKTELEPMYVRAIAAGNGTLWLSGYVDVNLRSGKLERIDEATHRYEGSISLDFLPSAGLAAADGAVWIADPVGDKVVRIDAATRKVVARIPVGPGPAGVAVGAGSVWVTNYDDGTVSRIDPSSNTVVATIAVGKHPDHIAADEGGIWVAVHAL